MIKYLSFYSKYEWINLTVYFEILKEVLSYHSIVGIILSKLMRYRDETTHKNLTEPKKYQYINKFTLKILFHLKDVFLFDSNSI